MATVNGAHADGVNQQFSILGVIGTLGTADEAGTAPTLPIGVNPDTGAMYVQDLSGASGTTNVAGTVAVSNVATGTITRVEGGSIVVTSIPQVSVGTVPQISVGTIPNIPGGSIVVTSIPQVSVGTIPNIPGGSIVVTSIPQVSVGTIPQVSVGTIPQVSVGTIPNIPGGTIGVITSITNLAGGTIQKNPRPSRTILMLGTTTTGTIGTIVAAGGSGSTTFVNDVSISSHNGTVDVALSYGINATGQHRIVRGQFGANGGIQKSFPIPVNGNTTNTAIAWNILSGSGTISIDVSYWIE